MGYPCNKTFFNMASPVSFWCHLLMLLLVITDVIQAALVSPENYYWDVISPISGSGGDKIILGSPSPLPAMGSRLSRTLSSSCGKKQHSGSYSFSTPLPFSPSVETKFLNLSVSSSGPELEDPVSISKAKDKFDFKEILTSLKAPRYHLSNLEVAMTFEHEFFMDKITFHEDPDNVLEVVLKVMIRVLMTNQSPERYIKLMDYFLQKMSLISEPINYVHLEDLIKVNVKALLNKKVSLITFSHLISPFLEFLINADLSQSFEQTINMILKIILENFGKDSELEKKFGLFLESVEGFVMSYLGYFPTTPVSEANPLSYFSIYIINLYKIKQISKIGQIMRFFDETFTGYLSTPDYMNILTMAAIYNDVSTFKIVLANSMPNFNLILGVPEILSSMSSVLKPQVPKMSDLNLNLEPERFTDSQGSYFKNLLQILLHKSSHEEIFYYLLIDGKYQLMNSLLEFMDSRIEINYSHISKLMKDSGLGIELTDLIVNSFEYFSLLRFVYNFLRREISKESEIDHLILHSLSQLPSDYYSSSIIGVFVELSNGFGRLFNLARKQKNFTVLEILAAFYRIEHNFELLEDEIAAERSIVFRGPVMHVISENGAFTDIIM